PSLTPSTIFVTLTFDGTSNLAIDHPWDIAFIDSTHALFTERPGRISVFDPTAGSGTAAMLVGATANTLASGESGLMGIAVDPAFSTNHFIYVCISSNATGSNEIRR